ncbi:DUF2683 family protein [Chryseobacterium sp. SC28]|uniref:DUF2683 family protein n=1 Tax=Chryseobacterium sp. SC28 TaxID=2268028 RepID=UPI000F649700|nr:DUF2683 family protein [Chryseobacterium sp. SC28]RRQ45096.1 hypothetical protein DTW91_12090 [Chryseobacterium sp. SC28]
MESIIVHPKNPMELAALKSVLKDMNIEFEKFHTKNNFHNQKIIQKITDRKEKKIGRTPKPKGL